MDLPVFRGFMMVSMVEVRKSGVHVGSQYIHINGIWQVQMGLHFWTQIKTFENGVHLCLSEVALFLENILYGMFIPQIVIPSCLKKPA
jgi:hypothetical protein